MSASSPTPTSQRCEQCGVQIESNIGMPDKVIFSNGPNGTRSKLWMRVCRFHKTAEQRSKCINQDAELRGPEQKGDAFPDAPSIDVNSPNA
ncbi:hypothetical protein OAE35_02580 [Synechococcus sp. AH-551-E02]|nr:hypothetical protein [Synechococcus sp. AH-551-E02]MDB4653767.1 hypothetical protein [Synechococcus sp. AH-551-E02]